MRAGLIDQRPGIEPTSERVDEEHYQSSREDYLIYLYHLATYRFSLSYVRSKRILDFGCGTGYGTALIAPECKSVIGADISADAIRYASSKYSDPRVQFVVVKNVEEEDLPFREGEFDVVLSLQVIEHIKDIDRYLSEIYRVLKVGGVFIAATPDRTTRLLSFQKPWNRFHVKEYSAESLGRILTKRFRSVKLFQMGGTSKIIDFELTRTRRVRWLTLPITLPITPEWLRICSLKLLKTIRNSVRFTRDSVGQLTEFGFSEEDLRIGEGISPSINIIVVATRG